MIFNFVINVFALLSVNEVEKASKSIGISNLSIINPLYGYMAKTLYLHEKIRFLHPKMNTKFKGYEDYVREKIKNPKEIQEPIIQKAEDQIRVYSKDEGLNELCRLILHLYPSNTGMIETTFDNSRNIAKIVDESLEIKIGDNPFLQFFARSIDILINKINNNIIAFDNILENVMNEIDEIWKIRIMRIIPSEEKKDVVSNFDEAMKWWRNNINEFKNKNKFMELSKENNKNIKSKFEEMKNDIENMQKEDCYFAITIIQIFMIDVCKTIPEFEEFLKMIETKDCVIGKIINKSDEEGIEFVNEKHENYIWNFLKSIENFPYSSSNPPPTSVSIRYMKKIKNGETEIDDNKTTFPGCCEISLLNLCNCLLFDRENKRYDLSHLKDNAPIRKFYEKPSELFKIDDNVLTDWGKIIECLDDFENQDDVENNDILKIKYVKGNEETNDEINKKNELNADIITCINVLIKIFGLDYKEIWGNEMKENKEINFKEVIEKLINKIYIKKEKQCIEMIKADGNLEKYYLDLKFSIESQPEFDKIVKCEFEENMHASFSIESKDMTEKSHNMNSIEINHKYYEKLINGFMNDTYKMNDSIDIEECLREKTWYFSRRFSNLNLNVFLYKISKYLVNENKEHSKENEYNQALNIFRNILLTLNYNDFGTLINLLRFINVPNDILSENLPSSIKAFLIEKDGFKNLRNLSSELTNQIYLNISNINLKNIYSKCTPYLFFNLFWPENEKIEFIVKVLLIDKSEDTSNDFTIELYGHEFNIQSDNDKDFIKNKFLPQLFELIEYVQENRGEIESRLNTKMTMINKISYWYPKLFIITSKMLGTPINKINWESKYQFLKHILEIDSNFSREKTFRKLIFEVYKKYFLKPFSNKKNRYILSLYEDLLLEIMSDISMTNDGKIQFSESTEKFIERVENLNNSNSNDQELKNSLLNKFTNMVEPNDIKRILPEYYKSNFENLITTKDLKETKQTFSKHLDLIFKDLSKVQDQQKLKEINEIETKLENLNQLILSLKELKNKLESKKIEIKSLNKIFKIFKDNKEVEIIKTDLDDLKEYINTSNNFINEDKKKEILKKIDELSEIIKNAKNDVIRKLIPFKFDTIFDNYCFIRDFVEIVKIMKKFVEEDKELEILRNEKI